MLEVANRGLMNCAAMARFAAETFGYPLLDIAAFDPAMFAREAVDRKLLAKHQVAPLAKRQNRITLATADPSNMRALDEIRFQTGMQLDLVIAEADKLKRVVDTLSESAADTLKELTGEAFDMDMLQQDSPTQQRDEDEANEVDDAPVVKFIQKVLIDAINEGASDVHFEPYEKYYRIRVRTDGILRDIAQPPLVLKDKIAARIKVISRLDISEKRLPQDGRIKLKVNRREIDVRVSIIPMLHGEGIVMRLLDKSNVLFTLQELGMDEETFVRFKGLIDRPHGIILVTGPTGSGKSTTLAAMIDHINKNEYAHILSVEDPIEFVHTSQKCLINQREVHRDTHGFNEALRSALREDPDYILVGELRDLETIRLALTAAETGHLVFATLHTSSAAKTIDRVVDVFPAEEKSMVRSMLSESLQAVISQTLLKKIGGGRVAAHEIMIGTPAIRNLIREDKVAQMYSAIQTGNSVGMQTLDQNLADLVRRNIISPAEARSKAKIPENFPG